MQNHRVSKRHTKTTADERHAASRNCQSTYRTDALLSLPVWPGETLDRTLDGRRMLVGIIERELRKERRLGIAGDRAYDIARHARLALLLRQEREALHALAASQRRQ